MRSIEDILSLLAQRKVQAGSENARMEEIRRLYNSEMNVPLPELGKDERALAANLAQLGIDQMAMRLASVTPNIRFYPDRLGSEAANKRARLRRDIISEWWDHNRVISHIIPKRGRWFFGYAVAPVVLRPGNKPGYEGLPCWYERDPLGTYPASVAQAGDLTPPDSIFCYRLGYEELRSKYPAEMSRIVGNREPKQSYEVVEYIDAEQITCVVVGGTYESQYREAQGSPFETLYQLPNRAERPLTVIPGRITLDRPLGQFDALIGAYLWQARIMALYLIAQEKAIFPETWVVSPPGAPAARIDVVADPREGIVGEVTGGSITKIDMSPNPLTANLMDRLEYVERVSGAIPAEFSGLSSSNVRTGRRGDSIMSAAIDYRLQEAQTIFAESLEEENRIAIAIAKAYAGSRTFSMYVPLRGVQKYVPSVDLADDQHTVTYAYAGADANALTVALGQKLGLEVISRETAMSLDPLVEDVEGEKDRIVADALERAFLQSIQVQASQPQGPYQPRDMARIVQLVREDRMSLAEAVQTVDDEIKERQARAAANQPANPLEQMPGLGVPGAPGTPGPPPSINDIGSGIGNLSEMLTQLRRGQMPLPVERRPLAEPEVAR